MSICMIGIDHNSADLDVRGLFSLTKKKAAEAYDQFRHIPGISGSVILSTCNRTEWWMSTTGTEAFSPVDTLCSFLGVDPRRYESYFTHRRDAEAVDHLFRMAAGLDSRILGEDQIVTQVGEALAYARACYSTDHTLEVLFRLAVTAAKRVKTETCVSSRDQSVIHTALKELRNAGVTVTGKKCMVIGNGMMGRISAQALMDAGANVTVTVREYHSGVVDIPSGAGRIGYKSRFELLPECDFVVSATTSPNYTLQFRDLAPLTVDHNILFIDLAVPRDIDPAVRGLGWVTLYDIDSFRIDPVSDRIAASLEKAGEILREEEERFYTWYDGRDFVPQIQRLKTAVGADVSARMTPVLRRANLGEDRKKQLSREAAGASERMLNHLLFGMRSRLPDAVFHECLDAMEHVLNEQRQEEGFFMDLTVRPRRLRSSETLRKMVRETRVDPASLMYPMFVMDGENRVEEISAMPGQNRYTVDRMGEELQRLSDAGVSSLMLFGIPAHKDEVGSQAWAEDGVVQRAIRQAKKDFPHLFIVADVCMCEYTSHGHCGVLCGHDVDNDSTLELLARTALSQVEAGADMVAPSDMMDGRILAIRECLDAHGHAGTPIMSYAVKYASSFYGPFREAAGSAPSFGDRKTYQMDFHNRREGLKEALLDVEEGADIIMVKPAMTYLDVVRDVREAIDLPVACYSTSGEYAMVKAGAAKGWIDEDRIICEMAVSAFRAGTDIYLTYFAKELARAMREGRIG
ncbi:MAG: porphobilinogen synthase [Oscillospiraceae bacterium]|nr:porphobilinogen synthase [Oscillospiraceae bacterium]